MLQTAILSATDFPNYVWPENELATVHTYMTRAEPLWEPPSGQAAGAGRNFDDVVGENLRGLFALLMTPA